MLSALEQRIVDSVDEQQLTKLGMDLVNISSPTGEEEGMARFLLDYLKDLGLKVRLQPVEEGRYNCIGTLEGSGGGKSLMFNGHLDTSFSGREPGLPAGQKPHAFIDGRWIYGLGIYNMKAALACYAVAVETLLKAGVRPRGDIILGYVAGEIEKVQTPGNEGKHLRGYGIGSKWLAVSGVAPDMCIIGEPTVHSLVLGHFGSVWTQIQTPGTLIHSAFYRGRPNAILRMNKIVAALQKWIPEFESRYAWLGRPADVNIAGIEAGASWRATRTASDCKLYIDVRFPPDRHARDVQRELKEFITQLKAQDPDLEGTTIEFYAASPGAMVSEDEPVVDLVKAAHQSVHGEPVSVRAEGWYSDASPLVCYGIPTINYGPSGRTRTGEPSFSPIEGEHVLIDDMVQCTQVYAVAALRACS